MKPQSIARIAAALLKLSALCPGTLPTALMRTEHSRHRSVANCFVNLVVGLVAYTWREKKPSLNIRLNEQLQLVF